MRAEAGPEVRLRKEVLIKREREREWVMLKVFFNDLQ